jgi:hypothetical protein
MPIMTWRKFCDREFHPGEIWLVNVLASLKFGNRLTYCSVGHPASQQRAISAHSLPGVAAFGRLRNCIQLTRLVAKALWLKRCRRG